MGSGTNFHRVIILVMAGLMVIMAGGWQGAPLYAERSDRPEASRRASTVWPEMISEADKIGLPTMFLRRMTPTFVEIEFEDLRSFAAEYHPEQHRMVLNRSLSFHAAGRTLKPLSRLGSRDLGTLYHELFHAYMDFVSSSQGRVGKDPYAARVLNIARKLQRCRYQRVLITPVVQRKSSTEVRLLTERESWEALNETWAVFVGWAVWTRLELRGQGSASGGAGEAELTAGWLSRLQQADRDALLLGYYEPEDPRERRLTRKRYLAPSYRITPREIRLLLEVVFGETSQKAAESASAVVLSQAEPATSADCDGPLS